MAHGTTDTKVDGGLAELRARMAEGGADVLKARGRALRRLRGLRDTLTWIRRTPDLPPDLASKFAREVLRDALAWLYATRGKELGDEEVALTVFDETFADAPLLQRADVELLFRLERDAGEAAPLPDIERLLGGIEGYVRATLSTERERSRARLIRRSCLVAVPILLAVVALWFYLQSRPLVSRVDPRRITKPGGIVGTYYNGRDFDRKVVSRVDGQINLNTSRSPARGVATDNFSVRWEGFLQAPDTSARYLCVESDDGARVFLQGKLLINDWTVHPYHRACKKVRLAKGWFPLRVDFFEVSGGARVRLLWGPTKKRLTLVPAKHLCCRDPGRR